MTSRERVQKTLRHQEPDRVPVDIGSTHVSSIHIDAHENLKKYLGLRGGKIEFIEWTQQAARVDERILEKLQIDTHCLVMRPPDKWKFELKDDPEKFFYTDEWGISWQKFKNTGFYYDIMKHPLQDATREDLENLNWPDPDDSGRFAGVAEELKDLLEKTDYAIVADVMSGGVLEAIWFQTGLVRFLTDLMLDPDFIKALLEKSLKIQLKLIHNFLQIVGKKVLVVAIDGDLGGQNTTLISPELYRELLKPYEKRIMQFVRTLTSASLFRHCCGSIVPLIDDLIEVGVETLNPVQVSAAGMDTQMLKSAFGDRLCFWGGIDNRVLAMGTANQVREEVRRRIGDLAPGGGYVLGAVHNIQRDVPPENICAMVEAARKHGEYPIA
jgi:uroporphyrinogen decarboxylase